MNFSIPNGQDCPDGDYDSAAVAEPEHTASQLVEEVPALPNVLCSQYRMEESSTSGRTGHSLR